MFTDGGCDEEFHAYWVDHAFTSTSWNAFCSERGIDVHCIGMMAEGIRERDEQTLAEREYMITRCKVPASRVFNDHLEQSQDICQRLRLWPTPELANFLLALYHDFEMGGDLGSMLFADCDEGVELMEEQNKLRDFVARLEVHKRLSSVGILRFLPHSNGFTSDLTSLSFTTEETQDPRLYYYDTSFTEVLNDQNNAQAIVGVIDSVTISRQGAFSCPVASGVLFSVQFKSQNQDYLHEEIVAEFAKITTSKSSTQFTDKADLQSILSASERGELSSEILTQGQSAVGQWVEFDSQQDSLSEAGQCLSVKPLLWFHFHSKDEIQEQNDPEWVEIHDEDQVEQDLDVDVEESSVESHSFAGSLPEMNMEMLVDAESILGDLEDITVDLQGEEEQVLEDHPPPLTEENKMTIPLTKRVGGNSVLLKLISQENRMGEFRDSHSIPNIDINAIILTGKKIVLPKGLYCV